jgi:hypothetical protein
MKRYLQNVSEKREGKISRAEYTANKMERVSLYYSLLML